MAVPDFQSMMLPLLQLMSDGREWNTAGAAEQLATQFKMSEQDKNELLPSGRQTRLRNRTAWGLKYLKSAGLVESSSRGLYRITDQGRTVLAQKPPRIDIKFLTQYPEFQKFRASRDNDEDRTTDTLFERQTPEETLDATYQKLRMQLAHELLDKVKSSTPRFFEKLVVELMVAMGYGGSLKDAGEAVGRSGDDGVDGIIKEDRLGLDVIYLQAKRWSSPVGRPIVQAFAGSLEGHRAKKGVLITTSAFSDDAKAYVEKIEKRIVLIDGAKLGQLMIDFGIGVTETARYIVKKVDTDYFSEGE